MIEKPTGKYIFSKGHYKDNKGKEVMNVWVFDKLIGKPMQSDLFPARWKKQKQKKGKTWREESREYGLLIGGLANISYELDGKMKTEKVKFVGKFWHIDQLDRTENDPYFKGVIFDMYNNEQRSVSWTEKEFYKFCKSFTELF